MWAKSLNPYFTTGAYINILKQVFLHDTSLIMLCDSIMNLPLESAQVSVSNLFENVIEFLNNVCVNTGQTD